MPSFQKLTLLTAVLLTGLAVSCNDSSSGKTAVNPYCSTATATLPFPDLTAQSLSSTPAVNWQAPHVPGEVIVTSANGLSAQSLSALQGLEVQQAADGVLVASTPTGQNDQDFAQTLAARGLQVQPNFRYQSLALPNDPAFPGNSGLKIGANTASQNYLTTIQMPEAWATLQSCGKQPVAAPIGLIDSGVEVAHPELSDQIISQASFRSKDNGTAVYVHGTATAGIMDAATNNAAGLSGIAWNKALLIEETLGRDGTTTADVIKALQDATKQGAKVINLSLGMPGNPGDAALDKALLDASQTAVLVVAAGNTAKDGLYYPASEPEVVAVGSITSTADALTCYSARPAQGSSRQLDIVAPGGNGAGYCNGAKPADDLVVLAPGKTYALEAGTSFAAPQVSAVAALMRAANPDLTAAQTKSLLLGSTNKSSGWPLLDANTAVKAAMGLK